MTTQSQRELLGVAIDGPSAQALRDLLNIREQQIKHAARTDLANALLEV